MRRHLLKIILATSLLAGCSNTKTVYVDREVVRIDTLFKYDTLYIDRALITDECLEYQLMVMNVRHYIEITEKNSNNKKFFYGWIKRAVQE